MEAIQTDLFVMGGGINGVGVAVDAAGRGLSVVLCEKDDLAGHTSSSSSKLIHGGLRYLEQVEFKLVHEALREREILLRKAPYLVHPMQFLLPHDKHLRSAWVIRVGLFLYDYLARRKVLKGAKRINLRESVFGKPLKDKFKLGFSYMDCAVDDSRLVIANAMAAQEKGAKIFTRTECVSASRECDHWLIKLRDKRTEKKYIVRAKALVNATGAWVSQVLNDVVKIDTKAHVRLIKGSHFTVPKLYEGDYAYLLQNLDGRIVFMIPYQSDFTLVGTTDVPFQGDPNKVDISSEEIAYLCQSINDYMKTPIQEKDINWSYSGVRALYDDRSKKPQKTTREYHLDINDNNGAVPIISIFGGKITTYRSLAEHVMKKLKCYFPKMKPDWTSNALLPGGNLSEPTFDKFLSTIKGIYSWMPEKVIVRYGYSYGALLFQLLGDTKSLEDMGRHFGGGLYEKEVLYWMNFEWAKTVDDMLWRRSKLGLVLNKQEIESLETYLKKIGEFNATQ